jgi:uncharacterized membrane protein
MPIITFTAVTAIVFCLGDAVMIPLVMRPLFKAALGSAMLDQLRLGPAALFYIIHIGGLAYFAGLPALRQAAAGTALLNGAILGFVTYSCYEMTSFTIMRSWTAQLVLVDLGWGTVISGLAAWSGAALSLRWRST